MIKLIVPIVAIALFPCPALAEQVLPDQSNQQAIQENTSTHRDKLADDPTKVITKVGFGYTNQFFISGSLALDEARKINVRINEDADEWRVGGSWLFHFGIVNFNLGKTEYEHGAGQNNYSIGTFVPLSVFGVTPFGFQIFPMAGYTHNDGEIAVENEDPSIDSDWMLVSSTNNSGYLGAFSLKPLTDHWNLMAFGGGSTGSDDYSGYWLGGGVSCEINDHNSFNVFGFTSDNSYGEEQKVGVAYTHQFY